MSAVTTTRHIDAVQLTAELGVAGITVATGDTETTITADIDEATLQAAVDAHVPASKPTEAEVIANLKERLATTEKTLDQVIIDALMGDFPPTL